MTLIDIEPVVDPFPSVEIEACWLLGKDGGRWPGKRWGDTAHFPSIAGLASDLWTHYQDEKITGTFDVPYRAWPEYDSAEVFGILAARAKVA